jgi:hypothetical protein
MAVELGNWLSRRVDPTLAWDYPTIDSLAAHLGGDTGDRTAAEPAGDEEVLAILREVEMLSPRAAQEALERELLGTDLEARHG